MRSNGSATFQRGTSTFAVERRGDREFHRESVRDETGRILAEVEAEVKYALGSGARGVSYLVEHDGRLYESPISWYTQKARYDFSPGYQGQNLHFDRPIVPSCLFCHANRVEPVDLSVNLYRKPIFQGHALGCERCHGPGDLHVKEQEVVDGRDLTIVNPRHLEPALRDAVCEQCHLVGDVRIERLDRHAFDYRPGLPLTEFFTVYGRTAESQDRVVGQVEQLRASRCFRESEGRLGCTSCHDPHRAPAPAEKTAFFRRQCQNCHGQNACTLTKNVRLAQNRDDNCVACHMPRFSPTDAVHVAISDHRILRKPAAPANEPVPGPQERPSNEPLRAAQGLPLVLLNGEGLTPQQIQSLGREMAIALAQEAPRLSKPSQVARAGPYVLTHLDQALAQHPDDLLALRMKAQVFWLGGRTSESLRLVEEALRRAPGYEDALDQYLQYAIDLEDAQAALEPARRAVNLNPCSSVFHERLAYASLEQKDWTTALRESREALRLNPFLRFARMFLIRCHLHDVDLKSAQDEFSILIKLNPTMRQALEEWFGGQIRPRGRD
jgi:tetratricopeptide (TPR) repeat protein